MVPPERRWFCGESGQQVFPSASWRPNAGAACKTVNKYLATRDAIETIATGDEPKVAEADDEIHCWRFRLPVGCCSSREEERWQ